MASKFAYLVLFLYTCAVGTVLTEILQCFISPDSLGPLVAISAGFADCLENWGILAIYVSITIIGIRFLVSTFGRILFYFRPALREKVKESLRKKQEEQLQTNVAVEQSSTFTYIAYAMLCPLLILNGSIVNRKQGTPLVEGAVQRFLTVAKKDLYIWGIELAAFFVLCLLSWALTSIFRAARRSCTAKAPAALEEGSTEEIREVKGGIYNTAANYIQTSIIDEKLVDLDEPMPKLIDVDEPAPHAVQPVTRAPVDLL